jgi:putative transposase
MTLRKITKNRSLFPNDEVVFKLMYLGLRNISKRWTMPIRDWSAALNQFAILFEGRVPVAGLGNSFTQNPV